MFLKFLAVSQKIRDIAVAFAAWMVHASTDKTSTFIAPPTLVTDSLPPIAPSTPRLRPFAELVHALRFLTRLPVPFARTIDPPPLHQSMRMFSVAGALIGVVIAGALIGVGYLQLPPLLAGLLVTAFGILMTGALHEDGIADVADGFGGGHTPEQRLTIMRDSRIGSYGALALIIAVAARASCYAALMMMQPLAIIAILAAVQSFSRAMVVDLMWAEKPARSDGLSIMAGRPSSRVAVFTIVVGLALMGLCTLVVPAEKVIVALGFGLAGTAIVRRMAVKLIGGQTGDVCGAVQVTSEIAMLTAIVSTLR
jgi:adenosylcobinamide-GDP ribazoletransferase